MAYPVGFKSLGKHVQISTKSRRRDRLALEQKYLALEPATDSSPSASR